MNKLFGRNATEINLLQNYGTGYVKGYQEGYIKGFAEGFKIGFEEGMKHFRDIFIQAMKQQGFSDETIVMIMQACEKQDI